MVRKDGDTSVDAAEVGLALAFPGQLRAHLGTMSMGWAPVEAAVSAGWAGMERLRVVTAAANHSVARPRVIGLTRLSGLPGVVSEARDERSDGVPVAAGRQAGATAEQVGRPSSVADAPRVGGAATRAFGDVDDLSVDAGPSSAALPASRTRPVDGGAGVAMVLETSAVPEEPEGDGDLADETAVGSVEAAPELATAPVLVRVARVTARSNGWSANAPELQGNVAPAAAPTASGRLLRADVRSALASRVAERPSGSVSAVEGGAGQAIGSEPFAATAASGGLGWAGEPGGAAGGGSGPAGAAAPQAERDEGGERLLGDIVLDGHLVGQWMSDRMARDAARPGAGTTGFDPRQAPAWTPSGAV